MARTAPGGGHGARRLRVATWNLWWHFGPWQARQPAIVETMRAVDADVWCLQEVFGGRDAPDQADALAEALGGYHVAHASRFDLGRFGSITPFAQIYASGKVYFRPTNEAADTQNAYYLLNFRLGWRSEDLRLGLDVFVDNAIDKDVATTKLVGSSLLGSPLVDAYDRPRTFGARASLAW